MTEVIETRHVKEALVLADLLATEADAPIGELIGETGSGKTFAGRHIVERYAGVRVCAFEGMTRHQLMRRVVEAFTGESAAPSPRWMERIEQHAAVECEATGRRPVLVVDEANKLGWRQLEALRFLADECGVAVLLSGTELYTQQFQHGRTAPLLFQLGRRIGAKRVAFERLDRAACAAHVITPRFGEPGRAAATRFWHGCRKGNWGEAVELAQACERVMRVNNLERFDEAVVQAALQWQANAGGRHAA